MKRKICFVCLDAYPVLNPKANNHYFGGESVQHTLLAKAFKDLDYDVSLLSVDYGQPEEEYVDGIRVLRTYADGDGLPGLRFIHPKLTSIISALKKADADVYFQSCAGMLTGVVAWFCRKYERKFIFRLAHDNDCIPDQLIIRYWRDKKLYEYGLHRTDLISAQGVRQVKLLKDNYGLESTPINMTVQLPDDKEPPKRDIDILWVNNIRQFKRPELVPELAALLPEYNITMIGGPVPGHETMYDSIVKQAKKLDNLDYVGAVPYHEVNSYFDRSKVFINTSDSEGFPNSFLQAWIRGVPIISFFDPDGLIASEDLGFVPQSAEPDNLNEMAQNIKTLLSDRALHEDKSKRCRQYALEHYSPSAVAKVYADAIFS